MREFSGNLHLIILAGGKGERLGGEVPKQFRDTGHGPLFLLSLQSFLELPPEIAGIKSLTFAVPDPWQKLVAEALGDRPHALAPAGKSRTASTWNALQVLARSHPLAGDLVAIHDAARPLASADLLARLVEAAGSGGAAIPTVPVTDTIIHQDGRYLDRASLGAVQTPQVFSWDIIEPAHAWAAEQGQDFTDDGSLVTARGHQVELVNGAALNFKVTTPRDWDLLMSMMPLIS